MRLRVLSLLSFACIATLAFVLSACGGASSPAGEADGGNGNATKGASATYVKFFEDTVNGSSGAKWTIQNSSGTKLFALSNTFYSSPKAWIIGQNYWNSENDRMTSIGFTVPDPDGAGAEGTAGVKLAFYSRWSILSGDFARVDYSTDNGGSWTQVQAFTNGSNANYPAWTKYTYSLPDNFSGADKTYRIRFRFTSNSSGVDWGFGVDTITVYQRQLDAPTGVAASDGDGGVVVTWDAAADPLLPTEYWIYVSDTQGGAYQFVINTPNPQTDTNENASFGAPFPETWWYKVRAYKPGYPLSPYSNSDEGSWVQ